LSFFIRIEEIALFIADSKLNRCPEESWFTLLGIKANYL